jgi:hypothetical protein
MIEVEVRSETGAGKPEALAELIAATLHGHALEPTSSSVVETGKIVREQQELSEQERPSWQEMATVEFETLDDEDLDWTEV